jgi:hypothetical protein
VYVWNLKGYVHITNRGIPWEFGSGAEDLVLKALKFVSAAYSQVGQAQVIIDLKIAL